MIPDETLTPEQTPVEPFGATLAQVEALVPNITWVTGALVGQTGPTSARALEWLEDLSARVELALDGWRGLDEGPRRVALERLAADAVAHGAASYASAAANPEQVGKAELAYHQVLWNRHEALLEQAGARLVAWLDEQNATTGASGRAAASFPCPAIPDRIGF